MFKACGGLYVARIVFPDGRVREVAGDAIREVENFRRVVLDLFLSGDERGVNLVAGEEGAAGFG